MPAGSNFVVHGTKPDGSNIDFGPYPNLQVALAVANAEMAQGHIINWTINYTDPHGHIVDYEQT